MLNDLTDQKITKYPMLTTSQKLHITINQILATSQKCKYGKDVQGMKKKKTADKVPMIKHSSYVLKWKVRLILLR